MIPSSNVTNSVGFVNYDIKNIDFYSGHTDKDFIITLSSSHRNYKSSPTDNSENVKSYSNRYVQENRKIWEKKKYGNGTADFSIILSSSYNDCKGERNVENTSNVNNNKSPYV